MSTIEQSVEVSLTIPGDVYERVEQAASRQQRPVAEILSELVEDGLHAQLTNREQLEQLSSLYRSRLEREGKLQQSSDEVLTELRDLREQITREIYP